MKLISREDLKRKLDEGEDLKLVFALSEWAYRAVHIPGSIYVEGPEQAAELLNKDDQIVVYCTNVNCPASIMAYNLLAQHGYGDLRRYAGGLEDWEKAGYPLVGEMASRHDPNDSTSVLRRSRHVARVIDRAMDGGSQGPVSLPECPAKYTGHTCHGQFLLSIVTPTPSVPENKRRTSPNGPGDRGALRHE